MGLVVSAPLPTVSQYRAECRIALPDGRFWVRSSASRAHWRDDPITGAIIDITREKVLLEQLCQNAERMHRLNGPPVS